MFFLHASFWFRALATSVVVAVAGLVVGVLGGGVGPCTGTPLSIFALLVGMLSVAVAALSIVALALAAALRCVHEALRPSRR